MTNITALEDCRGIGFQLVQDVFRLVQANRPNDWNRPYPKLGDHFHYQELQELASFQTLRNTLQHLDIVQQKLEPHGVETLIEQVVSATLAHVEESPSTRVFDAFWEKATALIRGSETVVRTIVGLANYNAVRPEFQLNSTASIQYFGDATFREEAPRFFRSWDPYGLSEALSRTHAFRCKGALVFDIKVENTKENIQFEKYRFQCIDEMLKYTTSLRLAGFGRLLAGPWITINNPDFPFPSAIVVGESDFFDSTSEPTYQLSDDVWKRFESANELLGILRLENKKDLESYRDARNRFTRAIARFESTYKKGLWESAIVDLVIAMESLYLPKSQGGRLHVAIAASNLLGIVEAEAREVFESILAAYAIRNKYVHGEPITTGDFEKILYKLAMNAGLETTNTSSDLKWYALETVRDYARRSILALLNLHYRQEVFLTGDLERQLVQLHLDTKAKQRIQSGAQCFPLSTRPHFSTQQTVA
jgi:hypothetical protein